MAALEYYNQALSLEQIIFFEYIWNIAKFSKNRKFQIRRSTIEKDLRLTRYAVEKLQAWLEDLKILISMPRKRDTMAKLYEFSDKGLLSKWSEIYSDKFPVSHYVEQHKTRINLFKP